MEIISTLAKEFKIGISQVERTVELIDEGNTIPFIARYRKEVTGSLDDTLLRDLFDRLSYLRNIAKRRAEVKELIAGQGKLTPEIEAAINAATTLTEVDDIYRPFRPKRRTRASIARERGLEPLAELIIEQEASYNPPLEEQAGGYVDEEKGVKSAEEALAGAMDIIAEDVSDNADIRKAIRSLTWDEGALGSTGEGDTVYTQYYDYSERLRKIPGHRILAINRGEKEEALKVTLSAPRELILKYLSKKLVKDNGSPASKYVAAAIEDGYDRLLAPSVEREIRGDMFDLASEGAIKLFADNLRHLLMQSTLKGKTVLGFDPGYRTGCKLAVVDPTGKVIDTSVIYPTKPQERIKESGDAVVKLIRRHGVDVIAIGNGTASRESELFIANLLKTIPEDVKYVIVSEAGASVYSASKVGAEEFPDFDVTQRSAVSIARRLQDPLAELVKIDPKSIGVGQYQHDMKPARLDGALSSVVEDCVNAVGVDLNTASHSLLSYISGINATSAKNVVKYREENGEFTSRKEILKVPKIGAKAFEQCAGFLRIPGKDEILDNTGVHPESYSAARELLLSFGYTGEDVRAGRLTDLSEKVKRKGADKVAASLGIGEPTLFDIVGELEKPGRDVRDSLPPPMLREDVLDLADLKEGMLLTGTVRNVIDFGAFVDIGVHQDGLVHISQLADRFVKHPSDVVSVGDVVEVRVIGVDLHKKKISLSMKGQKQSKS